MSEEAMKARREKSPLYPAATIEECFEFVKSIDKLGGKVVSYASILEAMGLTSSTTKSFLYRVGASKQYGLITTGSSTAQLTDIAKKILYPTDNSSSKEQLKICFDKPPLYSKLIERFKNKAIPSKTQLSNILMNDFRIIKNSKDNAAECFINSAEYLGLLQNGVLVMENDVDEDVSKPEHTAVDDNRHTDMPANEYHANNITTTMFFNFEIPTLSGKSARISIPNDVTGKDLDYINLYIENMLPAFIKNLKEELDKQ